MKKSLEILFYLLCVLFSLGQIGRMSFLGQQINAYLYEVPLLLTVFLLITKYKLAPLINIPQKVPAIKPFFMYIMGAFILSSFFYSIQVNMIGLLYLIRISVYFLFFIYIWYHYDKNKIFADTLFTGFVIVAILTALFSVIQYFLYPNLRNISYLGWDPHWYRMVGTFFDPPVAGAIYGLFLIFFYKKVNFSLPWKIIIISFFALCLLLTYARGTYLGFFIVLLAMFFRKKLLIGLVLLIVVGIVALVLLPKPFGESVNLFRTFTIASRIENYQEAITDWSKHPVIGVGYNRIRYTRNPEVFHNQTDLENNHAGASYHSSFLIMLVSTGVIGLGLFIWLLYSLAKINDFAFLSIIFLSLLSITDNVVLHPFVLFLVLILIVGSVTHITAFRKSP